MKTGTSNPVSHMSLTMTSFMEAEASFMRSPNALRRGLFRMCYYHSTGSEEEPVITTLMKSLSSLSLCHHGLNLMISFVRSIGPYVWSQTVTKLVQTEYIILYPIDRIGSP
jgi:hypothetical protein